MLRAASSLRHSLRTRRYCAAAADSCRVCIVGGGMVGSAAAMHLADAGVEGVRVLQASDLPSSSNDYSRLIGPGDPAADLSVQSYRDLEQRSGVRFWEDVGLLEVVPAHAKPSDDAAAPAGPRAMLRRGRRYLSFQEFFGRRGFDSYLTEEGRGWIDPRALSRACRVVAERGGARWQEGARAVRVEGEQGAFVVTAEDGAAVRAEAVVLAVGAFAGLSPALVAAARGAAPPHATTMWGKTLYHARISPASAERLAPMPPLLVWPTDGVPAPEVSYEGAKAGSYFYVFPPVRYEDGGHYLKIGHSPYDPVISSLGGGGGESGGGGDAAPAPAPTEAQVAAWFAGAAADAATPLGREVAEITARSAAFFEGVLGKLVAADWEGGYATNCVTAKSGTGKRLLGELAPGLFHQTGCNGAGAAAALAWGGEVAEAVAGALERSEGR